MTKEKNREKGEKTVEFVVEQPDLQPEKTDETAVTDEPSGRYEIIEELAHGGSGKILVAFDRHIGRKIAMKELISDSIKPPSENDDPQKTAMRNRFLREAKLTGRLEHPAIVPVYEIGRHPNGAFYYTMRLIKGTTLLQAIRKCENLEERLKLLSHFYNICNAVAYSHSKGVINRDLKPSNVMIGEFGETVVLDWGLAKLKGSDETVFISNENFGVGETVVGQAIGTPSYMPPEQAKGRIDEIDEMSDIYSLGAMLYQILTGIPPFSGKTVDEIIRKVMTEKVENAAKRNKDIPPELAAIAEKALSKKKKERYASVAAMLDDLASYFSGKKVGVYRYSLFETLKHIASRHKTVTISSLVIFVITLLATIQIAFALKHETAAREEAETGKITANYRTAQAFSEKSDKLEAEKSYIASRVYAAAAMLYNPANKKSPEYNPEFAASLINSEDMLSKAASKFYIKNFHRGAVFEKDTYVGCRISTAAASEEGDIIAAGCENGDVSLFNFPDLTRIYKFDLKNRVSKFHFSPDAKKLDVLLSNGEVFEINIPEKTAEPSSEKEKSAIFREEISKADYVLPPGTPPVTETSFKKGTDLFITASKNGRATVWDLKELIPLFVIDGHNSPLASAFFVGNGHIATAGEEGFLRIWKRLGKKATKLFDFTFSNLQKALSVQEFTTITLSGGNLISIVSKNDGFLPEKYEEDFQISDFDVSKDAKLLVVAGKDGTFKLYDREKKERKETNLGNGEILSVKISPDSDFVLVSSVLGLYLVRLETFETKSAKCENPTSQGIIFAPNGKKSAAVCDGEIRFFSIPEFTAENKIGIEGRKAQSIEFMWDSNIAAGFDKGILSHINTSNNSIIDFSGKFDKTAKIAVSKDGLFAATTAENTAVKLWNVREHKLMLTISTDKKPECVFFEPEQNLLGICDGENLKFYPIDAPDLKLSALELLRKMEKEAGMELKDFYLEIPESE